MRAFFVFIIAVMWPILMGVAANAQTSVAFGSEQNRNAPVEATADSLSVDQENGRAVYSGNVVIGQGTLRLAASRVLVVFNDAGDRISKLEATGGVTLVDGDDAAEAQSADYNLDARTIVMQGNVLLTQGPSAITSDRMVVDLDANTAQMSGRVKTVLQQGN